MSPLCSRNARPQKALVGRAQWETHPGHPGATYTSKLGMTIIVHSPAALLDKHFEHPAGTIPCCDTQTDCLVLGFNMLFS